MSKRQRKPVTVEEHKLAERCRRGHIFIIDDDPEILSALSALLTLEGYFCTTYTHAADFLNHLNHPPVSPFPAPCCVLCDVKMPQVDGLEVQQQLAPFHQMALIMMSGASAAPDVIHAFRAGVLDFLLKPLDASTLLASIEKALVISTQKQTSQQQSTQLTQRFDQLTPREREVMKCVVEGKTNLTIAEELSMALRTVKLHRQRVMEKMAAQNVADLVRLSALLSETSDQT